MEKKRAINIIITLIILAAGLKIILYIANNYLKQLKDAGISDSFMTFMKNFGDLFMYLCAGLILFVALLYWLTKPSKTKELKPTRIEQPNIEKGYKFVEPEPTNEYEIVQDEKEYTIDE